MITVTEKSDSMIKDRLESLSQCDKDYWSFKGNSQREHGHGFLHYPAMMVAQLARAVLEQACLVHPEIEQVCDPFMGSGTVLTESMLRGLNFTGIDINPLSILLCRTKAGPFFSNALAEKITAIKASIKSDKRTAVAVDFHNRDKWFKKSVQIVLSRIRRAILSEDSLWARRFFWLGIAEAVRLTSNSRTSTVKLHIRTPEDIAARDIDPFHVFKRTIDRNLKLMVDQANLLSESGNLADGRYTKRIHIALGDVRKALSLEPSDLLLTSPPYGDNKTTVSYGQYSYLPLHWIDLDDIDASATKDFLRSTYEIDARSIGGSLFIEDGVREKLTDKSPAIASYLKKLRGKPAEMERRVVSFFRDLDACIDPILKSLRPGGLMIWALGNRKVGGTRVPLDAIVSELLSAHKSKLVCRLARDILSKRMAFKNNISETMSTETILIMRKAPNDGGQ